MSRGFSRSRVSLARGSVSSNRNKNPDVTSVTERKRRDSVAVTANYFARLDSVKRICASDRPAVTYHCRLHSRHRRRRHRSISRYLLVPFRVFILRATLRSSASEITRNSAKSLSSSLRSGEPQLRGRHYTAVKLQSPGLPRIFPDFFVFSTDGACYATHFPRGQICVGSNRT